MSGQKKGRALALTAIMVISVLATGLAFTGSVAADDRTDDLEIDVTPDNITVGSQADTVSVDVTNADDQNETYSYTATGPDGETVSGDSEDSEFSFALNPDSEGDYTVEVTATDTNDDENNTESDTATETVTAQYDLNFAPQEVAAGDYQQVVTGVLQNDQGEGISGEVLQLNAPDGTSEDTSAADANGQVSFQFMPDETGDYTITNPDSGVTYGAVTVTPTDLTVMSDKSEVTAGNEETVNFTVTDDGEQVNLSENNIDFEITQNGTSVQENGTEVDTDDDNGSETYRVDIDADQSTNAPVNVTASNDTAEGMTTLDVETTNVDTNASDDLTKGVRTGAIEFSSSDADGNDTDDGDYRFVADGGTVELSFNDNDDDLSVSSDDSVDTSDDDIELEDGESAVVSDDDDNDLNASAFAFNNSDLNRSVNLDVASQTDDDADDSDDLYGDNTTLVFDRLNGEAEPDAIPVTGDSAVDVTTVNGSNETFDRSVTLDGPGVSASGNTGDDGMTTFSVNPTQTGEIDLNVSYDEEYVNDSDGGSSTAPDSVQTDTVEVNNEDTEPPAEGMLTAQSDADFGSVDVGNSSSESVTLTNDGDAPVTVDDLSFSGDDADEFSTSQTTPFTLDAGESMDVSVVFTPDSAGDKSATLTADTAEDGSATTQLSGTGNEDEPPAEGQADVDAPDNTMFGDVNVSDTKTQTVTINNDGDATATVTQTSIKGPNGGEFTVLGDNAGNNADDESFTLAPGESRDLTVEFGPGSTGDKSATLITNTANDGRETTALTGTGVEAEDPQPDDQHTLTIVGSGDRAKYTFSVTDDLQKSTANGANVNQNDEIRRGYVGSGQTGISSDSYTYTGELETFDLDGDATVLVDGQNMNEEVSEKRDNVIEVAGTGERANYDFAATDGNSRLEKTTSNNANLNANDKVFRTTGNGQAGISADAYGFNGVIDSLEVDGNANVYVNGRQVNPEDEQDNMITIVGNGERATYEFTTDGGIAPSNANYANTNANDEIDGTTKTGQVGISADSNDYNGDITDFSANGDVQVYIDGEQIDQDDVANQA